MILTNDSAVERKLRYFIKNLEAAIFDATGYTENESVIYGLCQKMHEPEENRYIPRFEYRETQESNPEFYDVMFCDNRQYVVFFLKQKESEVKAGSQANYLSCYIMLKKNASLEKVSAFIYNKMRLKHPEEVLKYATGVNDVFSPDLKKSIVNAEDFKFNTIRIDLKIYSGGFCG